MATLKTCFKCLETKPVTDFYQHKGMADGHLNKCKTCAKQDVKKNYHTNFKHYQEYESTRKDLPHRKLLNMTVSKEYRKNHPERYRAHNLVGNAVRDGRLLKQACFICGNEKTEAHHPDYSRPLDVTWMCSKHHKETHCDS